MAIYFFLATWGVIFLLSYVAKRNHDRAKSLAEQLRQSEQAKQELQNHFALLEGKLYSSMKDPVTQLLSWQLFEDRFNQSIKESARYELTMGILYVDINSFNIMSDALGNQIGDALLEKMARRLESCVRQVDTIARVTKDIFVIVLTQLGKPDMSAIVAQRILQSMLEPFQIEEHSLYVTVSIGIATYPIDGQEAATLLHHADCALQTAKQKGKQNYYFYQEKNNISSQRKLSLITGLQRETFIQELTIYYQPTMNVKDENVFCMDALPYWQHPELGCVMPDEIFFYAEKQNKLNIMTEWLLRHACRQFLSWRSLGFMPAYLGIPLSITQLKNTQFIYHISQILKELQFQPEWLILEIQNEQSSLSFDVIEKAVNRLKYLKIKLALTHFGAGGFSLNYLKKLGLDFLKFDQTMIDDIQDNQQTMILVRSLILMGEQLAIEFIAQGVESNEQVIKLRDCGCSLMQGKCFGEALPEKEVPIKWTPAHFPSA